MIIKATKVKSIRHAGMLAAHLKRTDENEISQVREIRGMARADDLDASLRSMQRATELTRGKTGLFHVAINPRDYEADQMTEEQWQRTLQAIEEEFGLEAQPRAIVEHRKNGRSHFHAVYQLTDTEKGKLIDVKNDHYRCQALGRQLEQEFSHELTPNEPSRDTYNRDEQQQAKRLGESVAERRASLRADYQQAKDLAEFRELLAEKGYTIAQGDRAAVVLVDSTGEVFGLTRELGIKAREVRQLLGSEIDRLPTVADLKDDIKLDVEPEVTPAQSIDGRDLADSQDIALAMIRQFKQAEPGERKTFSFTFNQSLETPLEMLYSDLLAKQTAELERLNIQFYEARESIKQLQADHYDPNAYAGEINRLDAAFERDQEAMKARFEIDRQTFLGETPALTNDLEPSAALSVPDVVSDSQDKAIDVLAEFRAKGPVLQQDDDADDPLKDLRYNPDDDVLKELRDDSDILSQFRSLTDEQTRQRSRGLGLG